MEFFVYETRKTIVAKNRPVVIITSNNEKELPERIPAPLLLPLYPLPGPRNDERIVHAPLPRHPEGPRSGGPDVFFQVRDVPGLKKKPATSELLDWLKLLMVEDLPVEGIAHQRKALVISAVARCASEEPNRM